MSRDHSETCDECGYQRGGLDDLSCACDDSDAFIDRDLDCMLATERLRRLAHNLAIAGALCKAFVLGYNLAIVTHKIAAGQPADRLGRQVLATDSWFPNVDGKVAP